jgi:uncharacterized protein YjbI with pentapeptide repeats
LDWSTDLWPWLLVGVLGLIGIVGGWWLWWRLPKRQADRLRLTIRDAKARADVEDSFRKTIGQLLGGSAVLLGAGFAYLQFQQQQRTAEQQQRSARDLLISNQVSKGFEQLGSDKLAHRLGGIYALEGVMNTSEQYHRPVLEALCAFVREGARAERDGPPATDIQAALTVIGRRATEWPGSPDLRGAHIPHADLIGANLSSADLADANLSEAQLEKANLISARLTDANLSKATLWKANLFKANLFKANLSDASLHQASLSGALLNGANLSRANLWSTNLSGALLNGANLSRAYLNGANLSRAYLNRALNLTQPQLDDACGSTDTKLPEGLTLKPCR